MTVSLTSSDITQLKTAMVRMLSPYAASSERNWLLGVTAVLKKLLRADKASVRVVKNNRMGVVSEDIDDQALSAFAEYYYKFDAGRAVSGSVSHLPRVWTIEQSYKDRLGDFYRSEYYNDFHVPWKTLHGLCVSIKRNPGPLDGVMYFHKERRSAPEFDARSKAILRIFRPALRVGLRHGYSFAQPGDMISTIELMNDGCALVTLSGTVIHRNPAMASLMAKDERQGNLPAAISESVAAIMSLKSRSYSRVFPSGIGPASVSVGGVTYVLTSCCLGYFSGIPEPVILVTAAAADRGSIYGWMRLNQNRFNLSPREREVAILLTERKSNNEIASRLGISVHTARHHAERVLGKLGVPRKSAMNGGESKPYAEPDISGS